MTTTLFLLIEVFERPVGNEVDSNFVDDSRTKQTKQLTEAREARAEHKF